MGSVELKEIVLACGHRNISAMHDTTIQITKERALSRKGDCIIAVGANRSVHDLTQEFKNRLRKNDTKIVVRVEVGGMSETIVAYGDSRLILNHPTDTVIRKSGYICNRTLAIHADKSASDLSRELVSRMQDFRREIKVTLTVEN